MGTESPNGSDEPADEPDHEKPEEERPDHRREIERNIHRHELGRSEERPCKRCVSGKPDPSGRHMLCTVRGIRVFADCTCDYFHQGR